MKYKLTAAASIATALCVLGGCSSAEEQSSVNVIDVGGSFGQSASAAFPQTSDTLASSSTSFSSSNVQSAAPFEENSHLPSTAGSEDNSSENNPASIEPSQRSSYSEEPPARSDEPDSDRSSDPVSYSEPQESESGSRQESEPPVPIAPSEPSVYQTLNYGEVRGVWISYIELAETSSGSAGAFAESLAEIFDNCVSLGINTVYVHVRSHGDAYYDSKLFPRTKYLSEGYDPLPIMIDEAHKRGLSFQAWINPLRACAVSDIGREEGFPIYDWAGKEREVVRVGNYYYLNPAYDNVVDLIARGAYEIAANYDVDGLHIDDYFYPTTDLSFDRDAFQNSSYDSVSEFRFANCDKLVGALYDAVKSANANALFGISCQGSLENNYNQMYADVEKWCLNYGYTDYIMPQIYYGFDNSTQPFASCVRTWDNIAAKGKIPLIVGLSASKIGSEDVWAGAGKDEWITDKAILKRQFLESIEQASYGGICLYSYRSVFEPNYDVREQVESEISALKSALN